MNIQNDKLVGVKGLHTISLCDVRSEKAKRLQNDILRFSAQMEDQIRLCISTKHRLISTIVLEMGQSALKHELEALKADICRLKEIKYRTLKEMYAELRSVSQVNSFVVPNIIPTTGRSVLAMWIIGDNTYDANNGANYGSLGDDNTAPVNGDTTLGNETYRKATSSAAQSLNVAFLSNFYAAGEATGTIEEAGWHIDGTGVADSGQLLSHFLTGTIVKSATETLTVESQLTIS